MLLREFLEQLQIGDSTSGARHPDGSGGEDKFTLLIDFNGHGKAANAKVTRLYASSGFLGVGADAFIEPKPPREFLELEQTYGMKPDEGDG